MAKARRETVERPYTRNVCALAFVPGNEPQVLLLRHETSAGVSVYDGFGGLATHALTDPQAGEKSCSEYVYDAVGVLTRPEEWTEIVTLRGEDWEVSFFFSIMEAFRDARSLVRGQDIAFEDASAGLPLNTIPSLRWLVPLALDENVVKPLGLSGITL